MFAIALLVSGPLHAEERSVVLSVPEMRCPACPVAVMVAIQRVDGVSAVNVDFDSKLAKVAFDDQITSVREVQDAAKKMGFGSRVVTE